MSIVKSIGRYFVLATGVGGAIGGTAYYQNQKAQEMQEVNRVTYEKKLSNVQQGFDAKLWFQIQKSEALIAESNRKLQEQGEKLGKSDRELQEQREHLRQTQDLINSLQIQTSKDREELQTSNQSVEETRRQLKDITGKVSSIKAPDEHLKTLQKALPSTFIVSSTDSEGRERTWAGGFIKVGGKRYGVTCAHSFKDLIDFGGVDIKGHQGGEINIRGYRDLYSFDITPQPLPNGRFGFIHPSTGDGDLAIFCLTNAKDAVLDSLEKENKVTIGLKLRDLNDHIKPGEPLFNMGYPENYEFSLGTRFATGTFLVTIGGKLPQHQIQVLPGFNKGDSGSFLIDSNGKVAGMVIWVRNDITTPLGFGTSNRELKIEMDEVFGIHDVMEPQEKSLIETRKLARKFVFPTPLNPIPFGNFIPRKEIKRRREMVDAKTFLAASKFLMPTPLNPIPIGNLLPGRENK